MEIQAHKRLHRVQDPTRYQIVVVVNGTYHRSDSQQPVCSLPEWIGTGFAEIFRFLPRAGPELPTFPIGVNIPYLSQI